MLKIRRACVKSLCIVSELEDYYDGEKNSSEIQLLKGMIREFEEELVWANYGVELKMYII